MKTNTPFLILLVTFCILLSCSKDDKPNVNTTPEFQSLNDEITSLPGQIFVIKGTVSDPAGIESINLKYDSWFLDKTIYKDSLPKTYELAYSFKVPADAVENSTHNIAVTAVNSGGKTINKNVTITLNQDIASPEIIVNSPINGATVIIGEGDEMNLNLDVSDRELKEIKIESAILNETVALSGSTYNYSQAINITEPGNYEFSITVTDVTGNESSAKVSVNVVSELKFNAMYLTDETTDAALNKDVFGIPFITSASQEAEAGGYMFTVLYYSAAENSEVRFVAQEGSFAPYSFGSDPNESGKLVLGQDASVSPIIIPGVGYYEVSMDIRDFSYTITPYTPSDVAFDQVYILGRGVYVDAVTSTCTNNTDGTTQCWHFKSGKPFTQDANNEFLWTIQVRLQDQPNDEGVNGFILNANTEGWGPFWRNDPENPSIAIPGGGSNYVFDDSALDKDYTIIFDTHLNRIVIKDR